MPQSPNPARRIGVMFDRGQPPENLVPFARAVEEWGADDLWVVEDLTWGGSVSAAAIALAATRRLRVGIGVAPAPLRNPALLAMELATLARLYPDRLAAGIGHGVGAWMRQVGERVASPLALLEETVTVVKGLLSGEEVTFHGRALDVDGVKLVHPPTVAPPVLTGVVGARSLELSGRAADGTILVEGLSPERITQARASIDAGRAAAGRTGPHVVVAYVYAFISYDEDEIRRVDTPVAEGTAAFLGVTAQEVFRAVGPARSVGQTLDALWQTGIDAIGLHLMGDDQLGQARQLLAACGRG